eukprot:3933902-Rhodomonas_salina.3
MKLDLISRRTIELYVNDGALEEATSVIDFSSREQMRAILNNVTGKTQTDAEVDAVIAVGQSYLQSLPLGYVWAFSLSLLTSSVSRYLHGLCCVNQA